jgi:hypothetical protein
MKIAISQPTFMPWAGYFGLIDYVDEFIFLNTVQFEKRSWQQRNQIKIFNDSLFLTVPVLTKGKRFQKINEVEIDYDSNFITKHKKTIKHYYEKSKFFKDYSPRIFDIYNKQYDKLSEFNVDLIKLFCEFLGINSFFSFSENLNLENIHKDLLIYQICKLKKCTDYISTFGSKNYLSNSDFFKESNIKVHYFNYHNFEYLQINGVYIKNLSILDLIFNIGPESLSFIKKNFYIE